MDWEGYAPVHRIEAGEGAIGTTPTTWPLLVGSASMETGELVVEVKNRSRAERSGQIAAPSRPPTRQSRSLRPTRYNAWPCLPCPGQLVKAVDLNCPAFISKIDIPDQLQIAR